MARLGPRSRDAGRRRDSRCSAISPMRSSRTRASRRRSRGATASSSSTPTAPTASSPTTRSSTRSASDPLQQYLIEFPGGRMQALSIAWDSRPKAEGGQRWFHLYPGQNIKAGDWLHWTSGGQNWNFTCAECHSTNLRKNFDAKTDAYKTTWSELNVACEACHGPGSNHVAWAQKEGDWQALDATKGLALALDERKGVTWHAGRGDGQRAAQRAARLVARNRHLRALPRPRRADLRRLRPRQAAARHASARAARRQPVLERRPDARGGLRLGLVRAEQDARAGRDLLGLPRSAFAQAQGARQRRVRAMPPTGEVRQPRRTRITPPGRPAPRAPRATCRRRRTWWSIRATIIRCAFRVPICR